MNNFNRQYQPGQYQPGQYQPAQYQPAQYQPMPYQLSVKSKHKNLRECWPAVICIIITLVCLVLIIYNGDFNISTLMLIICNLCVAYYVIYKLCNNGFVSLAWIILCCPCIIPILLIISCGMTINGIKTTIGVNDNKKIEESDPSEDQPGSYSSVIYYNNPNNNKSTFPTNDSNYASIKPGLEENKLHNENTDNSNTDNLNTDNLNTNNLNTNNLNTDRVHNQINNIPEPIEYIHSMPALL